MIPRSSPPGAPGRQGLPMPIYEYECDRCGHRLEVLQRISEDPMKTCPSCAEDALRKLISPVGFQLKGTGWYETDFKNKGKPKAGNGKDGESKGDGKKSGDEGAATGKSAGDGDKKSSASTAPD